MKQYLGFVNFLKRSIKSFSVTATPLYKLLKKDVKFMWTDECQIAFDKLKQAIIDVPPVQLPDYTKPFYVETDASASGIGACLLQPDDSNKLRPVHFASFRFNAREQKQSITFQELLACIMALKYFHKYIAYSPVIWRTDHRPRFIYLRIAIPTVKSPEC